MSLSTSARGTGSLDTSLLASGDGRTAFGQTKVARHNHIIITDVIISDAAG